jgi:septal ring factor EnvC (AmiA/AmiB activator)
MDQAQRLVDLSVERETMAVRLEEAQRQRTDLESRVNELAAGRADLERQLAQLQAEREQLSRQNKELEDEVLRLPEELAAVSNSRAFKILKAGPFMAMRQPLSTLLIIAGMGELTNLWSFSGLGSSVYIGVAAVVLVVTAVQFWASHD